MKSVEKKVAIITGGSRGIGLCISELLLKKNYRVVILDLAIDEVSKHLEKEIKEKNVLAIRTDITKSVDVTNSFAKVIDNFERIDVLVNNAGINAIKNFFEENEEDWYKVIEVNLNGVFLCCKAAIPKMIQNKYGRIVNISSMSGLKSSIFSSTGYCASKAGVIGFSRCLAIQVAKYNIRVNCIAPCTTETPMIAHLDSKVKSDYIASVPLGRIGKPMDIAQAVYFLISNQSDFITGETLNLNGGLFMK